MVGITTLDFEQ